MAGRFPSWRIPVCPNCGSDQVVPIAYGFPTDELRRDAERGKVQWGGCMIGPESPKWHCQDCHHEWGRLESDIIG